MDRIKVFVFSKKGQGRGIDDDVWNFRYMHVWTFDETQNNLRKKQQINEDIFMSFILSMIS
mgnify:FL=1